MKNALKWLIRIIVIVGILALLASACAAIYLHLACNSSCKYQPIAIMFLYSGLFLGIPSLILVFLAKTFGQHS